MSDVSKTSLIDQSPRLALQSLHNANLAEMQLFQQNLDDGEFTQEYAKAKAGSSLWEGCDLPSLHEYTYHFLWCLHAIKWFCERVA